MAKKSASFLGTAPSVAQLIEDFIRRPVVEAQVGARKTLVQKRNAKKMRQGLPLGGVAQIRADMAAARKHHTGHAPVICFEKANRSIGERQADRIAPQAEIADGINLRRIDAKRIQRLIDFPRAQRWRGNA